MPLSLKNVYAGLPTTSRGRGIVLNVDPSGQKLVYACEKTIVVRGLDNRLEADQFTEHAHATTVGKFSPNRQWVASGDASGMVKIWNPKDDHRVKTEYRVMGGPITDLTWSADSKRIAVSGDGRGSYLSVFEWDTGSARGELSGHSKAAYSIDYHPSTDKPFRAISGGEDFNVLWFEGAPNLKYHHTNKEHSRFVNVVRFSPDGALAASASMDQTVVLYDGTSGTKKSTVKGHTGGIYALAWVDGSSKFATGSSDRSTILWDAGTGKAMTTWSLGKATEDQVVGIAASSSYIVTADLAGRLTWLDPRSPKPIATINGHQKAATCLAASPAVHKGHVYTGGSNGLVLDWRLSEAEPRTFEGKGHTAALTALALSEGHLISASVDSTVRFTPLKDRKWAPTALSLPRPAVALAAASGGLVVAATNEALAVIRKGALKSETSVAWEPKAVALDPAGTTVAVGGSDNAIHLYEVSGDRLKEAGKLENHRAPVTALAYSPDGKFLASGDGKKEVMLWKDGKLHMEGMVWHAARITALAWSPSGSTLASSSLDSAVMTWDTKSVSSRQELRGVHKGGVADVGWVDETTIVTVGTDATVKTIRTKPSSGASSSSGGSSRRPGSSRR